MAQAGIPIANGTTFTGLRWIAAAPAARASSSALPIGSPYVLYNGAGELVAQGMTMTGPLATQSSTWGRVKALYR